MSATPPFGPAYDQSPDEGPRRGSHQWEPQAGAPRGAQGGRGQVPGPDRDGQRPQAGRPASGQGRQMPAAGGRPQAGGGPQAGGPQAGRGQARPQQSPYTSPQTGGRAQAPQAQPPHSPQPQSPQAQSSPPRPAQPYQRQEPSEYGSPRPPQAAAAEQTRAPEPFEEAAFADAPTGSWGDEEGTTAIGKLGYVPKEPRKRSDFQKKRSRARKTSPIPKIIAAIVVLGLLGGAGWWWFSRDDSTGEQTQEAESGLTYGKSEDPCSLADAAPLEQYTGDVEAEATAAAEQKNSGWEQSCTLTYGAVDSAVALLEFEAVSYDSDARASVSFEMSTGGITGSWTQVDPAPEIGAQAAAVVAIPDDGGTSNYQLHVQDGNVYLIVRLALVDSGLDQQGLTDLTVQLADSYLAAWRDAS